MRWLFVDDDVMRYITIRDLNPDVDIIWVQTVDAAIECLQNFSFETVFLDHDLGLVTMDPIDSQYWPTIDGQGKETVITSIRPLVMWIAQNHNSVPLMLGTKFISHTANPVGGQWTENTLRKSGCNAKYDIRAWFTTISTKE